LQEFGGKGTAILGKKPCKYPTLQQQIVAK
jgi:hypothetical protein